MPRRTLSKQKLDLIRAAMELEPDEARKSHLHAVLLKKSGFPVSAIIAQTGVPYSSIYHFESRFDNQGLVGIPLATTGGRPKTPIPPELLRVFLNRRFSRRPSKKLLSLWKQATQNIYRKIRLMRWARQFARGHRQARARKVEYTKSWYRFHLRRVGFSDCEIDRGQ